MIYQYPKLRKRRRPEAPKAAIASAQPGAQVEEVGLIEGKQPGSLEEWRVAKALWKYKLHFDYQFAIYGGRLRKGGQLIDFVVWAPFPIPTYVNGEYWHEGQLALDDKLKVAEAERYFGHPAIILWGRDLQTQPDADSAVARAFL